VAQHPTTKSRINITLLGVGMRLSLRTAASKGPNVPAEDKNVQKAGGVIK